MIRATSKAPETGTPKKTSRTAIRVQGLVATDAQREAYKLHLRKRLESIKHERRARALGVPVEAPSHFDTSRLPEGNPSGRVVTTRSFLLTLLGGAAQTTRVEFDATLGELVGRVERQIRAMLPETSKFEWNGSVVERQWGVTALDSHGGRLAEFDLKMANH